MVKSSGLSLCMVAIMVRLLGPYYEQLGISVLTVQRSCSLFNGYISTRQM